MLLPELIEKIKSTKVYSLDKRHCLLVAITPPIVAEEIRPIVAALREGAVEWLGLEGGVRVIVVEDMESLKIYAGLEAE